MVTSPTRRAFLASAGVTVASVVVPRAFGQVAPVTRESVAGMSEGHPTLVAYRMAIGKMQALEETNPLSWKYQANMHGVLANPGMVADWSWCMHGNWWFLPWHRGYLYFFERIIRQMSGVESFALPYWPWELPGQNVLPAPFRTPTYQGETNYLFDGTRTVANQGGPLRPDSPSSSGSFSDDWVAARNTRRFTTQYPELSYGGISQQKTVLPRKPRSTRSHGVMESRAHDLIHDAVGGNRSDGDDGNMSDPRTAANDPIFWLHHANVDRLWNQWLDIRGHENPADQDWYDQQFAYYDADGSRVVLSVTEILNRAATAYRYDVEDRLIAANRGARGEAPVNRSIVGVASAQPALKLGTTPFSKSLSFDAATKPKLMTALAAVPAANAEPATVLLRVENIRPPAKPRVVYDVFLTKVGEKPSQFSYAGAISFFGRGAEHGHDDAEGFTQGFDVTRLVQAIRRANKGELPELEVHVIPHSTAGLSEADLAKQKVDIPIGNVTLKLVTE